MTTKSKHTRWVILGPRSGDGKLFIKPEGLESGSAVATVYTIADARKIAAAPDMLEALKGLLDSGRGADEIAHALDIPRERIDSARAAIAQAEEEIA